MALDQATQDLLAEFAAAGAPPLHTLTPDEARKRIREANAAETEVPEMHRTEEQRIGAGFRVRALVPVPEPDGLVVYYHGGGWVTGDIDIFDAVGRRLAAESGCTVVLADYRKAPEHPYPAAVEDAWEALVWADAARERLSGRGAPLAVAGDSAGGNLAAVMAQRAGARPGPEIALQVLVYPVTSADQTTPSYRDPANQLMLTTEAMAWFWDHYCPPAQRGETEASPLGAGDLSGLPPAAVLLAEHDVLRSEGEAYARRLREAGVAVHERLFEGQMHGFFTMLGLLPSSGAAVAHAAQRIAARVAALA